MSAEGLRDTITPKSDQLNADDLLTGPITVTITNVSRGSADQPVIVAIAGGYQPYKPCKSMRRVMIAVWGDNGADWIGRSMTLYCDPLVKFGGVKVGGIRISHMSGIDHAHSLMLTTTRSKRSEYTVQPIYSAQDDYEARVLPGLKDAVTCGVEALKKVYEKLPACHEKNELWKRHGDNLKAEAEKAAWL